MHRPGPRRKRGGTIERNDFAGALVMMATHGQRRKDRRWNRGKLCACLREACSMTKMRAAKRRSVICLFFILSILDVAGHAAAQQSHSLAEDYLRTDFSVEDGLPDDVVNAVLQTRNGLLWVGTESGLASFDGQKFTPLKLGIPGTVALGAVQSLVENANGDLWVATHAGVVHIPRAALDQFDPSQLILYHLGTGPGDEASSLLLSHDGVLWAGTNRGLYKFSSGKFVEAIPAVSINRIAEALNGHLLIITGEGFVEWDGSKVIEHPEVAARLHIHPDQVFHAFQDHTGTMWFATVNGIARNGSRVFPPMQPLNVSKTVAYRTYEDPQGHIWIASRQGLQLATGDRLEAPTTAIEARCVYADQDGDLWVGTNGNGLVRLKRRIVHMFNSSSGLPNDVTMTVIAAHDGRLWVGNNCEGLSVFDGTSFKTYREKDGLANSCIWALTEDHNHDLWIGTYGGGLFRFRDGHFTQYAKGQGLVSTIVLQIVAAHDGSLWIATPDGVSHMHDGQFHNYTSADGLSSDRVSGIYQDRDGTVWAATQGGLDRLSGKRFERFPSTGQASAPFSVRFSADLAGNLYTADSPRGISLITNDQLFSVYENFKVLDFLETADHSIWFSGGDGIGRVALADLNRSVTERDAPLDYIMFDRADGLSSTQCSVGIPNIAITPDHKLWVATVKGLAMLDLAKLSRTNRRPKILMGAVTIGRKKQLAGAELTLAPGTHHVEPRATGSRPGFAGKDPYPVQTGRRGRYMARCGPIPHCHLHQRSARHACLSCACQLQGRRVGQDRHHVQHHATAVLLSDRLVPSADRTCGCITALRALSRAGSIHRPSDKHSAGGAAPRTRNALRVNCTTLYCRACRAW